MKRIECQSRSIITTDDIALAIVTFLAAADRRGRVVRITVPVVHDNWSEVEFIVAPGESLIVHDSALPHVELDSAMMIGALTSRRLDWLPRRASSAHAATTAARAIRTARAARAAQTARSAEQ